jgi:hypothetical protein
MDGNPAEIQRASQLMPEEGQYHKIPTPYVQEDACNYPKSGKSYPNCLHPSSCTISQ